VPNPEDESVSIFFLEKPLRNYGFDEIPIHTLMIILCSEPKSHLETISALSSLCRRNEFLELLNSRATRKEIMTAAESFDSSRLTPSASPERHLKAPL
jgi:mannitol/fructose-specific phosphotransferase system IIA component (Ntr-type)